MLPLRLLLSSNCLQFLPILILLHIYFFPLQQSPLQRHHPLIAVLIRLTYVLKTDFAVCSLSVYGQFDLPSNRHSPNAQFPAPTSHKEHVFRFHTDPDAATDRYENPGARCAAVQLHRSPCWLTDPSRRSDLSKPPFHLSTLTRVPQTFALIFFMKVGTATIQIRALELISKIKSFWQLCINGSSLFMLEPT